MSIVKQVKVILFQSEKAMLATREKVCEKRCAKHINLESKVQLTNVVKINAVKSLEQNITVAIEIFKKKIFDLQEIQKAMEHMLHQ